MAAIWEAGRFAFRLTHAYRPLFLIATWALIVGVLSVVPATAQYTTASLGGTVADPAGAVVPEAEVTVQNEDTGLSRTITSQPDGTFLFPALPVGHYKLTVTKSGFANYIQTGIVLTVNETASQTVALQVRTVSQEVNVSANAEVLPTRTSTVSQLIDNKRVVDLPLDGRQPQELLFLAAGTVNETGTGPGYCLANCEGGVYPGEQDASVGGM